MKLKLGIKISPQERPRSDDELLKKIDEAVSNSKRIPSWTQLRHKTEIADRTFIKRFGNKGKYEVFSHYRKWLQRHQPKSKNIKLVDAYLEGQGKTKTPGSQLVKMKESPTGIKLPAIPGIEKEVGPNLNFGNLIYEPTTHEGVVFLFGMVSKALGFSIEYIGNDFPDCVAKQYIGGRRERQRHVRIEFEYKSRDYNHPVKGCDIIVCWEDNWGDKCPLPVIELRTVIKKLRELPEFSHK